jgi:hypothetical protein
VAKPNHFEMFLLPLFMFALSRAAWMAVGQYVSCRKARQVLIALPKGKPS